MPSFFEEKQKKTRKRTKKPIFLKVDYETVEKQFNLPQTQIENKSSSKNNIPSIDVRNIFQDKLSDKRKAKELFIQSNDLCGNILKESTDIWCYWCKHPFKTRPFGCPIKYFMNQNGEGVYETYKIFCGLSCCMAHINYVKKYNIDEHIYRESDTLIIQMYMDIYDAPPPKGVIMASPDWTLLKVFGGPYEIEEFRKCNENFCITTTNMRIRPFPQMISSTDIFEKRCVF